MKSVDKGFGRSLKSGVRVLVMSVTSVVQSGEGKERIIHVLSCHLTQQLVYISIRMFLELKLAVVQAKMCYDIKLPDLKILCFTLLYHIHAGRRE